MAMNISLLLAARERILTHPELYDQINFCGSICCIAGHMVQIADQGQVMYGPFDGGKIRARAEELLGADSNGLFGFGGHWPERYRIHGYGSSIPPETAAEAIIDFIITDGWTKPADWKALAEVSPELISVLESAPEITRLTPA